ncbi:MAG: hypothetical protein NVS9B3_14590 [Gemmatimonadaceae bacterium]
MPGQHLPADHSKGDANTIGGYTAAHDRPAAFEGPDGLSYSVALLAGSTGDTRRPWGAYFLFVRWRRVGAASPDGHLETAFLAWGNSEAEAITALGAFTLQQTRGVLNELIGAAPSGRGARRWWDAMRDES